jgi:hypothetical protein
MHLLLAKIAEEENNSVEKDLQLKAFTEKPSLPKYG